MAKRPEVLARESMDGRPTSVGESRPYSVRSEEKCRDRLRLIEATGSAKNQTTAIVGHRMKAKRGLSQDREAVLST
jgi:hypothetical protein